MSQPYHELIGGRLVGVFGLPGHWEIAIVIFALLLLFGGKKLPELARGMARGLHIFKSEMKGIKTDVEDSVSGKDEEKAKSSDDKATPSADQADKGDKDAEGDKGEA